MSEMNRIVTERVVDARQAEQGHATIIIRHKLVVMQALKQAAGSVNE